MRIHGQMACILGKTERKRKDEPEWLLTLTMVNSVVNKTHAGQLAFFTREDLQLACFYLRPQCN